MGAVVGQGTVDRSAGLRARTVKVSFAGTTVKGAGRFATLASADLAAENSLDKPANVSPVERSVPVEGGTVDVSLPAYSLTLVRVPVR